MEHLFNCGEGELLWATVDGRKVLFCYRCKEWIREAETAQDCTGYYLESCHACGVKVEQGEFE